ncbi:hypothetical protein [Leifsonia xyli]|uniref:hypothetical protein n=1 Tax=Leifsonia xyli TaxID=1575 RepID=UPI003D66BF4A
MFCTFTFPFTVQVPPKVRLPLGEAPPTVRFPLKTELFLLHTRLPFWTTRPLLSDRSKPEFASTWPPLYRSIEVPDGVIPGTSQLKIASTLRALPEVFPEMPGA